MLWSEWVDNEKDLKKWTNQPTQLFEWPGPEGSG